MKPRSYLFVPADRPERFAKALASRADAVIVDLEDAVAPEAKLEARRLLGAWLAAAGTAQRVVVRVNPAGTAWHEDDLAVCRALAVSAVMVPKAERVADLDAARELSAGKPLIPLIESAEGIEQSRALARTAGVERLAFGSIDFQADLGNVGDGEALLFLRSQLVLVSRLASLAAPIDGVTTTIDDTERVASEALAARRLGFGAKLCIHPRQVDAVNRSFMPTAAELDWAHRVIDAADRAGGAAVAVDGKMVDRPVILRARALLARSGPVG